MVYERLLDGPGAALWRCANLWQRREREALAPHGLTPVQFLLLAGIRELEAAGPATQVALARHCGADAMMVSQVLRQMERSGLAGRVRHGADARARVLSLTARGQRTLERAAAAVADAQRVFFGVLGPDAEAFTGALGLLVGQKPRRRVAAQRS